MLTPSPHVAPPSIASATEPVRVPTPPNRRTGEGAGVDLPRPGHGPRPWKVAISGVWIGAAVLLLALLPVALSQPARAMLYESESSVVRIASVALWVGLAAITALLAIVSKILDRAAALLKSIDVTVAPMPRAMLTSFEEHIELLLPILIVVTLVLAFRRPTPPVPC